MTDLETALSAMLLAADNARKPLAVILAGHNGSGKSTLWYGRIAPRIQRPLINADRMMLSLLPERDSNGRLPAWAARFRDEDTAWMRVAQKGVEAFIEQATEHR